MPNSTIFDSPSVSCSAQPAAGKRSLDSRCAGGATLDVRAKLGPIHLLVVVGHPRIGSSQTRAMASAPGRIVFAGRQDDIENYYAAANLSDQLAALLRRAGAPAPSQAARKIAEDYFWTRHFTRLDALRQRASRRVQVCVS